MAATPLDWPAGGLAISRSLATSMGELEGALVVDHPVSRLLAREARSAMVETMEKVVAAMEGRKDRVLVVEWGEGMEEKELPPSWTQVSMVGTGEGVRVEGGGTKVEGRLVSMVCTKVLPLAYRAAPEVVVLR